LDSELNIDLQPMRPDQVSVSRWFIFFAVAMVFAVVPLVVLISREQWTWQDWLHHPGDTLAATGVAIKLLGFGVYLSVSTTFLPLPTGWIVAAVATQEAAVGDNVWTTTLMVALVGAVASTIANLNDYHLMTWMLRNHRIAKVRRLGIYKKAAVWFARSPFFLTVAFNVLPIPVDVVRFLAICYRYPRRKFAPANFIGRFIRYAIIAFVTYWWKLGWIAPAALLAMSVVLGLGRVTLPPLKSFVRKLVRYAGAPT